MTSEPRASFLDYANRLKAVLETVDWGPVTGLARELFDCWRTGRRVFLCGNGGGAGNASHIAADLALGVAKSRGSGLMATALTCNQSLMTCLANDRGYDNIFSLQLAVQAGKGDVLIALSASGDSPNIIESLREAKSIGMRTFAVVGCSGGRAKQLADIAIHFATDDMQIAEDLQLVVGHMLTQWLCGNGSPRVP
ncbi:MAG: SIS domain-containing protein [Acidobacteriota bacterium]